MSSELTDDDLAERLIGLRLELTRARERGDSQERVLLLEMAINKTADEIRERVAARRPVNAPKTPQEAAHSTPAPQTIHNTPASPQKPRMSNRVIYAGAGPLREYACGKTERYPGWEYGDSESPNAPPRYLFE